MEEQIFTYGKQLYSWFGWWSVAIVCAVTLIMIPINLLIKKIFERAKSDSVVRIRKTISSLMVFVVAFGTLALACLIFKMPFTFGFGLVGCVPTGALAMVVWAIIKVIVDCGIGPIISAVSKSKSVKKLLKSTGLDKDIVNAIYHKLDELVDNTDGENAQLVFSKSAEIIAKAESLLNGFTAEDNVKVVAQKFLQALQKKYSK